MIEIDGKTLEEDRKAAGYSRQFFVDALFEKLGRRSSVSSLRRAENGRVSRHLLEDYAELLGFPPTRYIRLIDEAGTAFSGWDLSGFWTAFYLEDDTGIEPYLSEDRLFIKQDGISVKGTYEIIKSDHPDGYLRESTFVLEGRVIDNFVYGSFHVGGRRSALGVGTFILTIKYAGTLAEGFHAYIGDDDKILSSRHAWVRNGAPDFRIVEKRVRNALLEPNVDKAPYITK